MTHLEYKGYTGSIEYSSDDEVLYGKVLGIKSLISFQGKSGRELEEDFIHAIDDYIHSCTSQGISPEKPFKGSFNVRIPSELHEKAAILAMKNRMSLNGFVTESIREMISKSLEA